MTDKRRQRRRRWARIRDYESAVAAQLARIEAREPSDEDRNAVEAIEDARRERDDG